MKKIFNILMTACLMMMAACSSEEEVTEQAPQNDGKVVITVAMPDQNDTRVSLVDKQFVWNEGDQILVIPMNEDGSVMAAATVMTLYEGKGTPKGNFIGNVIMDAPKYKLVYKTDKVTIDNGAVSMNYADITQTALDNEDHLKNHFLIASSVVTKDDLTGTVQMNLCNALLRVNLRSLPENLISLNKVEWILNYGETDKTVAGAINFSGTLPKMYISETDRYITIPVDVTKNLVQHAGKKMALRFNGSITRTVTVTTPGEKTYAANKRYNINVSLVAKDGVKAMTEWDTENDHLLDNQIWVKTPDNKSFYFYSKQSSKSLRGYYVYTEDADKITSVRYQCMYSTGTITDIIFPTQIERLEENMLVGEKPITCPIDLSQCKKLQYIGKNFSPSSGEIKLPLDGEPLTIESEAFAGYKGSSVTIPQTTVEISDLVFASSKITSIVFLPSYKYLKMTEKFAKDFSSDKADLTLNKDWLNPKKTDNLSCTLEQLTPTKTKDGKYMWMGVQWKSIKFVEVNVDGTPGKEVQGWAEGDDIDDKADEDNPQNGGALTSPGMKK